MVVGAILCFTSNVQVAPEGDTSCLYAHSFNIAANCQSGSKYTSEVGVCELINAAAYSTAGKMKRVIPGRKTESRKK